MNLDAMNFIPVLTKKYHQEDQTEKKIQRKRNKFENSLRCLESIIIYLR